VIYSYNKSQQDALFLKFILVNNSTRFGQTYCPSSGVLILYSQQLICVIQSDQRVSVHLTITVKSSGAQRLFDYPVLFMLTVC